MFRFNLNLTKFKTLFDSLPLFSCTNPSLLMNRSVHGGGGGRSVLGSMDFEGKIRINGPQIQQVRYGHKYVVQDLSIKWYRRRVKAMTQRLKVLNPSSPVIDQRTPLPPTNEGRYDPSLFEEGQEEESGKEEIEKRGVVAEINRLAEEQEHGRLFAVINLKGKQFKVTSEDIIIIQGYWAPDIGDRLRLNKILLLGSKDFTLLGRPLLDTDLVRVEGTVIEKTMSYLKLHFRLKKRKNFRRLKFSKDPYTMVRINMIELRKPISMPQETVLKEPTTIEGHFNIAANSGMTV